MLSILPALAVAACSGQDTRTANEPAPVPATTTDSNEHAPSSSGASARASASAGVVPSGTTRLTFFTPVVAGCSVPRKYVLELESGALSFSDCVPEGPITGTKILDADRLGYVATALHALAVDSPKVACADPPEQTITFTTPAGDSSVYGAYGTPTCHNQGKTYVTGTQALLNELLDAALAD